LEINRELRVLASPPDKKHRAFWPPVYFAAISVAVWAPALFRNGYVLLGDMVFTPAMNPGWSLLGPPRGTMNVGLVYNLAWLVSRVIGAVLLEKLVLFLMVFLPGYLMYRNVPSRNKWARYFAGTLYAINPFTYTRMLMGHWGFLLAYALLPVVVASTLKTVRAPSPGRCARTALWLAATAILSLHPGVFAVLICVLVAFFELARKYSNKRALAVAGLVFVIVLFCVLSAFWLVPGEGGPVSSITRADLKAFETRSTSKAGVLMSVAGMYGFWKTQLDPLLPRNDVPLWPAFALGFLALAVYGFWSYRSEPTRGGLVKALAVIGIIGFFLALGTRAPITGPVFSYLFDHFTFFRLFREPQKFASMLVLAYAMLGALGVERLAARRARRDKDPRIWKAIAVLLLVVVFFYSFRAFGGLWGEARAVSYPRSWAEAQNVMESDPGDWKALYLPPYWYMRFDFLHSDYTVNSPMPLYFKNRNVQLYSINVGGTELNASAVDRYVSASLDSGRERGNMGAMLAPLNVKYVVLALNPASVNFTYVLKQKDLEIVRRWKDLVLLRNRVSVSRLVAVDMKGSYRSLDQLGEVASGDNLLGSNISKGDKTNIPDSHGTPVAHLDKGPATVTAFIRPAEGKKQTLLFAEPYDVNWRLGGEPAAQNLGVTSAFSLGTQWGKVTITYRNTRLLAGYAVSGLGLILCVILLALDALKSRQGKDPV
jgi:hypothetical protein